MVENRRGNVAAEGGCPGVRNKVPVRAAVGHVIDLDDGGARGGGKWVGQRDSRAERGDIVEAAAPLDVELEVRADGKEILAGKGDPPEHQAARSKELLLGILLPAADAFRETVPEADEVRDPPAALGRVPGQVTDNSRSELEFLQRHGRSPVIRAREGSATQ